MAAVIGRGIQNLDSQGCSNSTFAPYYMVTFSLNGVAILAGVISQFDFHRRQQQYSHFDRLDAWYFTNGVFGVLHILACLYIVYAIERPCPVSNEKLDDSAFDYNNYRGDAMDVPPPPRNPKHIQAHEVVVVPMDSSKASASIPLASPGCRSETVTVPSTWPRISHVLREDKFVAIYILFFAVYLAWHFFMDVSRINRYYYQPGLHFVMRCADIFIMAGPASLLFSIAYTLATR